MALTSQRATLVGLCAIVLWSTTVGLIRSISESLGPAGGATFIYTASAVVLWLACGPPTWRDLPARYLRAGGLLFVSYEICLAMSIGLAHNRTQALELGMINYLWPSLTIVFAILLNRQAFRWWLWPGLALALAGIVQVLKGNSAWTPSLLWHNIMDNPLAYALAFFAAFAWAIYNNVTRRYAEGQSGVTLFFVVTAIALWAKFLITGQPQAMQFSSRVVLEVLFMAVSTATAYSAWNTGIQHGNMTILVTASWFTPVLSALLASFWLQLTPSLSFWQGVAMVTMGSLICWRATR